MFIIRCSLTAVQLKFYGNRSIRVRQKIHDCASWTRTVCDDTSCIVSYVNKRCYNETEDKLTINFCEKSLCHLQVICNDYFR